jgi:hypothetical protein
MSNKQRHRLLIIPVLVLGVSVTSIAYAEDFNPQPDPPARSKTKTNDLKLNTYKGGTDNSIHIVPGSDKSWSGPGDKNLPAVQRTPIK